MQDIYATRQADRVHGAISIARVVFHDLQDACTAKAPKRLSIGVLSATLRYVERVANRILHVFWKGREVYPVLPIQTTGLMLGDAIVFIICLNEHKGNVIGSDGVQIPKKCATTDARTRCFQAVEPLSMGRPKMNRSAHAICFLPVARFSTRKIWR
jgi:hypothetical protein